MKNLSFKLLLIFLASVLFFGCAGQKVKMPSPTFSPKAFSPEKYGPKVDAFAVLLDASASMEDVINPHWLFAWQGQKKFQVAKEFVIRMNQTIPELKFQGALRTFGHYPDVSKGKTALFFGPAQYSRNGFDKGIMAVKRPGGNTYMAEAIEAAGKDLESAKGKVAIIIVSDGQSIKNAVEAAKAVKKKYGDKLCIYTVLVGNDSGGKVLLNQLAEVGQCGISVNAGESSSTDAMADFVEKVFLVEYKDSDGDGVLDPFDECPGTPRGVKVDDKGCPLPVAKPKPMPAPARLDIDGDGVYNDRDKCPATPKGARVDDRGCWIIEGILFDFDKYNVKKQFYPALDEVVAVLKKNPILNVMIEGHTDNVGKADYNQRLSENRAKAVKEYIVKAGIESHRMNAVGYGLTRPAASNSTEEGRAKNRRVEITPVY